MTLKNKIKKLENELGFNNQFCICQENKGIVVFIDKTEDAPKERSAPETRYNRCGKDFENQIVIIDAV